MWGTPATSSSSFFPSPQSLTFPSHCCLLLPSQEETKQSLSEAREREEKAKQSALQARLETEAYVRR